MSLQNNTIDKDGFLDRLRNGDLEAFDALYLKYFKLLVVSAYYFLKDQNEAYDLTQNLFMDIWERKLYENFHEDIKGYLFLSIRNRCFNAIKAKERNIEQQLEYQLLHRDGFVEVELDNPDVNYSFLLTQLMDNLKGQRKTALQLVYFQKKKYSEAAAEMGIGVNSLKTHLKSALKLLRNGVKAEN